MTTQPAKLSLPTYLELTTDGASLQNKYSVHANAILNPSRSHQHDRTEMLCANRIEQMKLKHTLSTLDR